METPENMRKTSGKQAHTEGPQPGFKPETLLGANSAGAATNHGFRSHQGFSEWESLKSYLKKKTYHLYGVWVCGTRFHILLKEELCE